MSPEREGWRRGAGSFVASSSRKCGFGRRAAPSSTPASFAAARSGRLQRTGSRRKAGVPSSDPIRDTGPTPILASPEVIRRRNPRAVVSSGSHGRRACERSDPPRERAEPGPTQRTGSAGRGGVVSPVRIRWPAFAGRCRGSCVPTERSALGGSRGRAQRGEETALGRRGRRRFSEPCLDLAREPDEGHPRSSRPDPSRCPRGRRPRSPEAKRTRDFRHAIAPDGTARGRGSSFPTVRPSRKPVGALFEAFSGTSPRRPSASGLGDTPSDDPPEFLLPELCRLPAKLIVSRH